MSQRNVCLLVHHSCRGLKTHLDRTFSEGVAATANCFRDCSKKAIETSSWRPYITLDVGIFHKCPRPVGRGVYEGGLSYFSPEDI